MPTSRQAGAYFTIPAALFAWEKAMYMAGFLIEVDYNPEYQSLPTLSDRRAWTVFHELHSSTRTQ